MSITIIKINNTMIQPLNTGRQINSQFKTKAFLFDCTDPNVNLTDGIYSTDITFKNNAVIHNTNVKYFQDLSIYPAGITIAVKDSAGNILNTDTTPVANGVNQYAPGSKAWPNNPTNEIVAAGNVLSVTLTGITGAPIEVLSFVVLVHYTELDF